MTATSDLTALLDELERRKEHRCCECRRLMRPGTEYEEVRGRWDGDWRVFKTCMYCAKLRASLIAADAESCAPAFGYLYDSDGGVPEQHPVRLA